MIRYLTSLLLWITVVYSTPPLDLPLRSIVQNVDESCIPYDQLITDAIMTTSVSYLADNPRGEDPPINRKDVEPFTPSKLFEIFYKGKASAVEFKKSVVSFTHAKFLNLTKVDRVQFRKNLYKASRAGSFELGREIMSELLLMIVNDYSENSPSWKESRCLPKKSRADAEIGITIEFARLRNEIGEKSFGQFLDLGVGTTLAFVMDDTGSMSGEITAAKQRVERITDLLQNSIDSPQEYVLVPFNDPFVADVTNTRSATQFKRSLSRLYAHGGGDMPEMAMAGIQLAIENCRPGSTIYVITDASAKDYHKQDAVVAQAIQKQIVIVFMLTNDFRMSCRKKNSQNYKMCIELYNYIAEQTGGRVMIVGKRNIFKATEVIQTGLKQGLVVLKREVISSNRTFAAGRSYGIAFDVDPTVTELVAEATGLCGELRLVQTNGTVDQRLKRVGDAFTIIVKNQKRVGHWSIIGDRPAGDGRCEMKVSGKSTAGFIMTLIVKKQSDDDSSYRVLNSLPSVDHSLGFIIDLYGMSRINERGSDNLIERARFMDEQGHDVLAPLLKNEMNINSNRSTLQFFIEGGIPANIKPFYVVLEGRIKGKHFSRVSSRLMSVSHVSMQCNTDDLVFRPGTPSFFTVTVTNNGTREDTFTINAVDERGFATINGSDSLKIGAHKSKKFRIEINAPESTPEGTATKITISAKGWRPGSFQYHLCTVALGQNKRPRVDAFHIKGTISSRFAETIVRSTVTNDADVGRDAEFEVMLPSEAFISNLTMIIGNKTIVGSVEEKQKAKKIYRKAKTLGKTAGHVAVRDHSTQVYKTSLLVPARETVVFELTYQQLLRRVRGMYEYSLVIDPDQPVKHLTVDVHIVENSPIKFVSVPGFKTDQTSRRTHTINKFDVDEKLDITETESSTSITFNRQRRGCHVRYNPSLNTQTAHSPLGMQGIYTIQFDVERKESTGKSVVGGGYFAHFFSAPFFPNPPKMLTFVIDVSGSMLGHKMTQVRQALTETISSLNPNDYFNLVFFSNTPRAWIPSLMAPVSSIDIDDALDFISKYEPEGGTNIGEALDLAFDLMSPYLPTAENQTSIEVDDENEEVLDQILSRRKRELRKTASKSQDKVAGHAKMIVFLTDGRPTIGSTNENEILSAVKELNQQRVAVHTIGFGTLVDMDFLTKLSGQNGGVSRRVFESLDAATQLHNFIEEVTSPVMLNVSVNFESDKVEDLTSNQVRTLFEGSEIIVAGKILPGAFLDEANEQIEVSRKPRSIRGQVKGTSMNNPIEIDFDIDTSAMNDDPSASGAFTEQNTTAVTEKLWSYLRINDLLHKATLTSNSTEKQQLRKKALNMSLSYNFVTPVTSLITIKEEDLKEVEEEIKKDEEKVEDELSSKEKKIEELVSKIETKRLELLSHRRFDAFPTTTARPYSTTTDGYADLEGPPGYAYEYSISDDEVSSYYFDESISDSLELYGPTFEPRGGFYGDPHFVISITPDFNLCFNWDGEKDEINNLFYDADIDLTINGVFKTTPRQNPTLAKTTFHTYVTSIAFIFGQNALKLLIQPSNMTVNTRNGLNYTMPTNSKFGVTVGEGVVVHVVETHDHSSTILVSTEDTSFKIISHTRRLQAQYLDFSIANSPADSRANFDGILGQFINSDVKLTTTDSTTAVAIINGRRSRLKGRYRRNPSTLKQVFCWQARDFARGLTSYKSSDYAVADIFERPKYIQNL